MRKQVSILKLPAYVILLLLLLLGLTSAALAADISAPATANCADSILTYGTPPPRVIFTPKSFNKKEYDKLSCPQKVEVIQPLRLYLEDKINEYGLPDLPPSSEYSGLISHIRQVNALKEFGKDYGIIISFKYRGEEQFEKDKAMIKKLVNGYTGPTCKVLLVPTRYSYLDLMSIREQINTILAKYSTAARYDNSGEIGRLFYAPVQKKPLSREYIDIPEAQKFIQENGYASEVRVSWTGMLPDKPYHEDNDLEYQAEYEKNCGPWEEAAPFYARV